MWHTKNAFFREMQFWSHCYTVVSYQALFISVYKIRAVYLSGAKNVCFCTIPDFGSPTNIFGMMDKIMITTLHQKYLWIIILTLILLSAHWNFQQFSCEWPQGVTLIFHV